MDNLNKHTEFTEEAVKYLSGELSESAKSQFLLGVQSDPEKQKILEEYRKVWESVDKNPEVPVYNLDAEWNLLEGKLAESEAVRTTSARSVGFYLYRIAAVLLIGLILSGGFYLANRGITTELLAMKESTGMIELPDGTKVTLNSGSKIRYDKRENQNERRVSLSGEAFFEVVRDTLRPFVIDAGGTRVEVLGTSFNVNAYRNNDKVEITVASGLVAFSSKDAEDELILLKAGNTAVYDRNRSELKLQATANPNAFSWKTREIFFENTPLIEAIRLINKVYSSNLVLVNPDLNECAITVSFKNQSLDAVMNVLQSTLDLSFEKHGDRVEIEGPGCSE